MTTNNLNRKYRFIVSHDNHYNILKNIPFPKINVIKIPEFKEILEDMNARPQ